MDIQIAGLVNDSIVDGPGLRFTVFVQGCPHRCPGCHNPEAQSFAGGQTLDSGEILAKIKRNPLLNGVTFSGGEPFAQPAPLAAVAANLKEMGLNLWIYSGYRWEELAASPEPAVSALLAYGDVLVDGLYIAAERSLELPFRGSRNQRLLDIAASSREGAPVLYRAE